MFHYGTCYLNEKLCLCLDRDLPSHLQTDGFTRKSLYPTWNIFIRTEYLWIFFSKSFFPNYIFAWYQKKKSPLLNVLLEEGLFVFFYFDVIYYMYFFSVKIAIKRKTILSRRRNEIGNRTIMIQNFPPQTESI